MKKGKKSNQKRFSALSVFLCIKIALKHVIKKQRNPTNKSTRKLSNKKCEYAWNRYRELFIENELNKEKNRKCRYAHNLYDNFSKEKKRQKALISTWKIQKTFRRRKGQKTSICTPTKHKSFRRLKLLWKYKNLFSFRKFCFFGPS